jgi:hypothetical protein
MHDMPDQPASRTAAAAPPSAVSPDAVHLLRTTQQVQYQLSQMADQKASMLLGITFVIFTLTMGQGRMGVVPLPLLILGFTAFGAALLTVLAVLPSIKPPPEGGGTGNLLFFGYFARMTQDDFVSRMLDTAIDTRAVHEAFARDIYQNGKVLAGKKYRLLGWAYRVLLTGLVASLAAYVGPYLLRLAGL